MTCCSFDLSNIALLNRSLVISFLFFFFSPSVLLRLSPTMSTAPRVFSTVRFSPDLSTQGYCKVTRKEISFLLPCLLSYLLSPHNCSKDMTNTVNLKRFLSLSQKAAFKKAKPAVQAHLVYSCTCTCPLRHLAFGDTSLIHSCLLAPGCSDEAGDCTGLSWVVPAQPRAPGREWAQTPAQTPRNK